MRRLEPSDYLGPQGRRRVIALLSFGRGCGTGVLVGSLVAFPPDRVQEINRRLVHAHRLPQREKGAFVSPFAPRAVARCGQGQDG